MNFAFALGRSSQLFACRELLPNFELIPQSKSRLRFEETTQELIRFVKGFSPDQITNARLGKD